MGMMTVVSILNDGWETIKEHPEEFIHNIELGMAGIPSYSRLPGPDSVNYYGVGNHANPMEVSTSFHADHAGIFFVGQNTMTLLNDWRPKSERDMRLQLDRIVATKKALDLVEQDLRDKLKKGE